jgi:hypothetical protein
VQPVKIDVVRLQTAKRTFQGAVDILASVAAGIGIARASVERELSGQDQSVAQIALSDEFSDELFALAVCVTVGGVDEVSADFDEAREDGARGLLVRAPTPCGSEGHGAETERADAQPRPSECDVIFQAH